MTDAFVLASIPLMLKIRLQRRGKKNYATYRVVLAEAGAPIKGRFVADLGAYNPHTDTFSVKTDEVKRCLDQGAKATPTVHNLLVEHKVIDAPKVTSWRKKKREGEEETPQATTDNQDQTKEDSDETKVEAKDITDKETAAE